MFATRGTDDGQGEDSTAPWAQQKGVRMMLLTLAVALKPTKHGFVLTQTRFLMLCARPSKLSNSLQGFGSFAIGKNPFGQAESELYGTDRNTFRAPGLRSVFSPHGTGLRDQWHRMWNSRTDHRTRSVRYFPAITCVRTNGTCWMRSISTVLKDASTGQCVELGVQKNIPFFDTPKTTNVPSYCPKNPGPQTDRVWFGPFFPLRRGRARPLPRGRAQGFLGWIMILYPVSFLHTSSVEPPAQPTSASTKGLVPKAGVFRSEQARVTGRTDAVLSFKL